MNDQGSTDGRINADQIFYIQGEFRPWHLSLHIFRRGLLGDLCSLYGTEDGREESPSKCVTAEETAEKA